MKKILEFLQNDHIQMALVSGLCIIVLAFVFKRILHLEATNIESALPGFVFIGWELARVKSKHHVLSKVWPWAIMMLLVTGLVILRRVYF